MEYIDTLVETLKKVEVTSQNDQAIMGYEEGFSRLLSLFTEAKKRRISIYICGNGGSAGIAIHMTADLLKNGGLKTYSLYNAAVLTCLGNDLDYNHTFCKQLELIANKGDILIAISSSGKSQNIINAIETMRKFSGQVITFTGFETGNPIRQLGDYNVYVPISHYGIVESIHNIILQHLVDEIVQRDGVALQI